MENEAKTSEHEIPWYRWPENPRSGIVPWFVIVRRAIFWPLLLVGRCLSFVAVLGGFGLYDALMEWKR
jgi:hypothetical protein